MKNKKAVTLIELLISIFLLGTIVLTAVTIELAMRRMNTKPTVQSQLLDELMPVLERIKKDFEGQIGTVYNSSVSIEESGRRVVIRVDDGTYWGQLDSGDHWHAYRWPGGSVGPIYYSANNFTSSNETIADGVIYFKAVKSNNDTALNIQISNRKDPSKSENPLTNPGVSLNTTAYSRMASGR